VPAPVVEDPLLPMAALASVLLMSTKS
jgi:hypothetical protein